MRDDEFDELLARKEIASAFPQLSEAHRSMLVGLSLLRRGVILGVNTPQSLLTDEQATAHERVLHRIEAQFTEWRELVREVVASQLSGEQLRIFNAEYLLVPFSER
jgi:hypothetical protein